jgi:hypothetical protein
MDKHKLLQAGDVIVLEDGMTARMELRLTAAEKQKLMALGGSEWVRRQIARARLNNDGEGGNG